MSTQPEPARRHRDAARRNWNLSARDRIALAYAFARWEAKGYAAGEKAGIAAGVRLCSHGLGGLVEGRVYGNYPVTVSEAAANCRLSLVPPKARKSRRKP